jgi:hypothetical protein
VVEHLASIYEALGLIPSTEKKKKGRKAGRKEGRKEEKKEGRKEGRKEERGKEGRKDPHRSYKHEEQPYIGPFLQHLLVISSLSIQPWIIVSLRTLRLSLMPAPKASITGFRFCYSSTPLPGTNFFSTYKTFPNLVA